MSEVRDKLDNDDVTNDVAGRSTKPAGCSNETGDGWPNDAGTASRHTMKQAMAGLTTQAQPVGTQ